MAPPSQADIAVRVGEGAFEAGAELFALPAHRDMGAVVSFTGLVRGDEGVDALELEHFPGRTERVLRDLAERAAERWSLQSVRLVHRVGRMQVGEAIVFVAVAASHRDAAFKAARSLIDTLKTDAPFWKKEIGADLARWIRTTEADAAHAAAWRAELEPTS